MDVIFLIYGLAFLALGLVIVIRNEHESEFKFGKILWLLAAFGFSHGLLEWTDLWQVVRGKNLVLARIQPYILLVSYLFLVEFGRRLTVLSLRYGSRNEWIKVVLGIWIYLPLLGSIFSALIFSTEPALLISILSRYFAGMTGSLLTGAGFYFYWMKCIEPVMSRNDLQYIKISSYTAAASFLSYGVFGGLIGPGAGFFPASVINQDVFLEIFHFPVQLIRSVCAVMVSVSVGLLLRIFHFERILHLQKSLSVARHALADLKKMSHQTELILNSTAEGIFGIDIESKTVFVNNAALEILGYTRDEFIGKPIHSLTRHSSADGKSFDKTNCPIIQTLKTRKMTRVSNDIFFRKNGEGFPVEYATSPLWDENIIRGVVVVFQDITQRKKAENEIRHLAFYDTLTLLPNRKLLNDRMLQTMASAKRNGTMGALLFIGLDNFKNINETLGHEKGDELLKVVADSIVKVVRKGDTVARFGGDEFVVMLEDLSGKAEEAATQARLTGEKILAELNQSFQLVNNVYHSSSSIGITLFTGKDSVDELLKQAGLAMYKAKEAGRNAMFFFDMEMQEVVVARAAIENELRQSLIKNQFELYYQPQLDDKGLITGAEALLRWNHPVRGVVGPDDFITVAEDTGLILPIGYWVVEEACRQLVDWSAKADYSHLTIAINVSCRQFRQPDFVEKLIGIISRTGADFKKIKLEITESMLLENIEETIARMSLLKNTGISFSLDDFGTGYSSLSYLKKLPLDQLKIDKTFVRDVIYSNSDVAIIRAIIALAQSLGLSIIAEGVEYEAQKDFLAHEGCRAFQGYLFSKPLPVNGFEHLISGK